MDSEDKVLIKQLNFCDSDGDEASLYIVTSTACVIPEAVSYTHLDVYKRQTSR